MRGRLAALGHPGVTASTFHAAALRQLRHFWPRVHGTRAAADRSSRRSPILAPLAAGLPGGYRYLAVRDLAAEIEWAKARRIGPADYEVRAIAEGRDAPLPADLMAGLFRRYETAHERAGRIDFEDMLARTIELIESDEAIAAEVRDRYRWFSVDEFQDTNPLQAALLDAWLGGRDDLAVVGDEDQTIYTFTGATQRLPDRVRRRAIRTRGSITLETNYRSTPEILGLANRVLAAGRVALDERPPGAPARPAKRLVASLPGGPGAGDRRVRDRRGRAGRDDRRDPGARAGGHARTARWPSWSGPTPSCPPIESALGAAGHPVPRPRRAVLRPARGPPRGRGWRRALGRVDGDEAARRAPGAPPSSASSASGATGPGRRGGRRAARGGRHAARARRGPRPDGSRRPDRRGVPRRGRAPRPRSRPAATPPASSC